MEVAIRRWIALMETMEGGKHSTGSCDTKQGSFSGQGSDFGGCVLQQGSTNNSEEMQQLGKNYVLSSTSMMSLSLALRTSFMIFCGARLMQRRRHRG